MMNREIRKQKIAEIMAKNPHGIQDIFWHNDQRPMNVYEIPLEYLIYNKLNGRILSRMKTLEKQGRNINPETADGREVIEKLLWRSKAARNDITKKDINDKGQLKVGIVTLDGIVIDGNRRLMLLNMLKKSHFKAVVLPVDLEDEPIEIQKLETTYQMGEDEKLGYNPIEKYLKAKHLHMVLTEGCSHEDALRQIAEWMGEEKSEIQNYLDVVKIIDEYLVYTEYDGIYAMADTPNDGKEDLFLYIKKWHSTFFEKESNKGFDGYETIDVDALKQICFDYVRAKIGTSYDGKKFRYIADGQKRNHFFGDKVIWKSFSEKHFSTVATAITKISEDYPIDYHSENIEASLSARDSKFRDEVLDELKRNINEHENYLEYAKAADRPLELVSNAGRAIDSINRGHAALSSPVVIEQVENLIQKLIGILKQKSPEQTLSLIIDLLQSIEFKPGSFEKETTITKIKDVAKLAYRIEKDVRAT